MALHNILPTCVLWNVHICCQGWIDLGEDFVNPQCNDADREMGIFRRAQTAEVERLTQIHREQDPPVVPVGDDITGNIRIPRQQVHGRGPPPVALLVDRLAHILIQRFL